MSFRCRQRLKLAPSMSVIISKDTTLESGEVVPTKEDLTKEQLPDPALFDLSNQLKAGVDLEEVSSKVIRRSKVSGKTLAAKLGLEVSSESE